MNARREALFLDRDGVLGQPHCHPSRPEDLVLCDGLLPTLRDVQRGGVAIVVITDQSAIRHGYFTEDDIQAMHDRLRSFLAAGGVALDGVYHCPHAPGGLIPDFAIPCECRQPRPGLLLRAAEDLQLDLTGSWLIGDSLDDVESGNRAGCHTILVDRGTEPPPDDPRRRPEYVVQITRHALEIVLATRKGRPIPYGTHHTAAWSETMRTLPDRDPIGSSTA